VLVPNALITFPAARQGNGEARRWYADGGATAIVLSKRGMLLEPHPTFGPFEYRLLALNVTASEADEYARRHGFVHMRELRSRNEIRR